MQGCSQEHGSVLGGKESWPTLDKQHRKCDSTGERISQNRQEGMNSKKRGEGVKQRPLDPTERQIGKWSDTGMHEVTWPGGTELNQSKEPFCGEKGLGEEGRWPWEDWMYRMGKDREINNRDEIVSQEEGMRGRIYLHSGKAGGKEAGSN